MNIGFYTQSLDTSTTITNAINAKCSYEHSLVLKTDGTVWGAGKKERFGMASNNTDTSLSPVFIQITSLSKIIEIDINCESSYALDSDGNLWCAGGNTCGDLGTGNTTKLATEFKIAKLDATTTLKNVYTLSSKQDRFYALLDSKNQLYTIGLNSCGQAGNNSKAGRSYGGYICDIGR